MRLKCIIFTAFVLLLVSCKEEKRCYESTDSLMMVNFLGSNGEEIDSLMVKGIDRNAVGDTLVHDTIAAEVKHLGLPLSMSYDSTGFQVFANGKAAIFYLNHSMQIKLVSEDCGFAPEFQITGGRFSALIDSIIVTDPVVNNKSSETHATSQNILLYFHLADN